MAHGEARRGLVTAAAILIALIQLGWLVVCMFAFFMLGYDGGGFAGGFVSPFGAVVIALAPTLVVAAALAFRHIARR